MDSNKALLHFVSINHGQKANTSLDTGDSVVAEVDENLLQHFKTEEEENDHMAKLKFWGKEECELFKDDYSKFSRMIRKDLSAV